MRRLTTIAGLIALTLGSFVVVAATQVSAQPIPGVTPAPTPRRSTNWPPVENKTAFKPEWYSDLPWTQKLGTYRGNEIDEAVVLPFEALASSKKDYCKNTAEITDEGCMIEVGIVNILGTYRTDTPYTQAKCQSNLTPPQRCIEVKLDLAMFWQCNDDDSKNCSGIKLQPRKFGNDYLGAGPFGGYVINDGTTYAMQMPWYMSHYCLSQFATTNDALDPVCYADYLSTFNDGISPLPDKGGVNNWPSSVPWSIFPTALAPPAADNHCQAGLTTCTLAMGAFDLSPVSQSLPDLQYYQYKNTGGQVVSYPNNFLFTWFNGALEEFPADFQTNFGNEDLYHFPWSGAKVTWGTTPVTGSIDLYSEAQSNPFLGQFTFTNKNTGGNQSCVITLTVSTPDGCSTAQARADHYLYPRQCNLADLAATDIQVMRLRACGLNYELHHNGWAEEMPFPPPAGMLNNQYGRTSFLFAGVPGQQMPVSYYKPNTKGALSVYEQVHNASIFSLYLPIANEADFKNAFTGRDYKLTEFYHALLMTNHMESDPDEFAEGIRGRTLWHDEYRTKLMYESFAKGNSAQFPTRRFAASFDPTMPNAAPFHNNTCDACHVRNGSGIPINTELKLPVDGENKPIQRFMTDKVYQAGGVSAPSGPATDYTFTGQIQPMKLVFFDLKRPTSPTDDSVYSSPLAFSADQAAQARSAAQTANLYYNSTIMNFYGDSFHVTRPGYNYIWSYGPADDNRIVVKQANGGPIPRENQELKAANCTPIPGCYTYQAYQVNLKTFTTPLSGCEFVSPAPASKPWPKTCDDIGSGAILRAINSSTSNTQPCGTYIRKNKEKEEVEEVPPPCVGFMLLNGKRLGNLGAIEAIPNDIIKGFQKTQSQGNVLGPAAGEIQYNAGSRDGVGGPYSLVKPCTTKGPDNCFIGRFGWLGDRVSLEDQVANAAFIEMNMTTGPGYNAVKKLYPTMDPIRYNVPNCGPADQMCVNKPIGNGELLERDINRMAAYARWLGDPTRSEFTASLPDVIDGEKIFRQIGCNTCHVIDKIDIRDPDDTMLTKYFRVRLATRNPNDPKPCLGNACPFLSYLGTDLLMHDMGYLSQVGNPSKYPIRDRNGVVLSEFKDYVQKIRTPPLKGLRFNRFVTEAQLNTSNACKIDRAAAPCYPACDFLLHDGRACDAIEAAFLHDGPAINKLGVIPALNNLIKDDLRRLRAFLYSL
jgi:hypothetical protein